MKTYSMIKEGDFCDGSYAAYVSKGTAAAPANKFLCYHGYGKVETLMMQLSSDSRFYHVTDTSIGTPECGRESKLHEDLNCMNTLKKGTEIDRSICNARSIYRTNGEMLSRSPAWHNIPQLWTEYEGLNYGNQRECIGNLDQGIPAECREISPDLYNKILNKNSNSATDTDEQKITWPVNYPTTGSASEVCTFQYRMCTEPLEAFGVALGYTAIIEFLLTIVIVPIFLCTRVINTEDNFFRGLVVEMMGGTDDTAQDPTEKSASSKKTEKTKKSEEIKETQR
jgi:hypothetical protein